MDKQEVDLPKLAVECNKLAQKLLDLLNTLKVKDCWVTPSHLLYTYWESTLVVELYIVSLRSIHNLGTSFTMICFLSVCLCLSICMDENTRKWESFTKAVIHATKEKDVQDLETRLPRFQRQIADRMLQMMRFVYWPQPNPAMAV